MEKSGLLVFYCIANAAAFIAVIAVNALANILPLNGYGTGELSDLYPNLFVPAGVTFSIWGIIYILLAAFCIYSFAAVFGSGANLPVINSVGPWFLVSCLFNIGWIFAWHWRRPFLSLIFMLGLLAALILIYLKTGGGSAEGRTGLLFLKIPFSVYTGWITVATIANITAVLVDRGWSRFGLSEIFWTAAVIAAAALICLLIIFLRKDAAYSLVIIWALAGIIIKRASLSDAPGVITAAGISIAVIAAAGVITALLSRR